MIKKADDQVKYLVIKLSGCYYKKSGKWRIIKKGFNNRNLKKTFMGYIYRLLLKGQFKTLRCSVFIGQIWYFIFFSFSIVSFSFGVAIL